MKELLEFLRNERLKKCLKQAYLAEKLGVDESTISRWESGQITMDFLQIVNYATVLEIDVCISRKQWTRSSQTYCRSTR